jgi:hypothetical protein
VIFTEIIERRNPMSRFSSFMITSALATLSLMPNCRADNSPIVRDCSLGQKFGMIQVPPVASIDADLVVLSGATLKLRNGVLSVLTSQNELNLTATESVDPGDNAVSSFHVVQLFATVSTPGQPTRSFFGTGESFVILGIPLEPSGDAQVFTISWHATFDSGLHPCPAPFTPSNTAPIPFVVTVVPGSQ